MTPRKSRSCSSLGNVQFALTPPNPPPSVDLRPFLSIVRERASLSQVQRCSAGVAASAASPRGSGERSPSGLPSRDRSRGLPIFGSEFEFEFLTIKSNLTQR